MNKLTLRPINFKEASEFLSKYHRHHKRSSGWKFGIGLEFNFELVGIVICGRPVNRNQDDGHTLEITRCCTNGIKNGCSKLYSAAVRAGFAMGYKRIITYTLYDELGTSLKASNFKLSHISNRGS